MIKLKGSITNINWQDFSVTLKLKDIDENLLVQISDMAESMQNQFSAISINLKKIGRSNSGITESARRKWFAAITRILEKKQIHPDSLTLKSVSDLYKRSYLPCKEVQIDGKSVAMVPSINDFDAKQVYDAIELMIADYPDCFGDWYYTE